MSAVAADVRRDAERTAGVIRYTYKHSPTIRRFRDSRAFFRGLMGPFGSGKSSGCVMETARWASRQHAVNGVRSSRFAVVRNTYGQLADTTIKTWLEWLPTPYFGTYFKSEHVYHLRLMLADGTRVESEILFRALDRPEHVSNLLSLELTGAWCNEAREIQLSIIEALQGRVDRFPKRDKGGAVDPGIIGDTNPPDDDSWWYQLFEVLKPDNVEIFKQPSGRSPEAENLPNLSPTYYANLMKGKSEDFVKVYVDGLYGYVKSGRPVYPEYNDGMHCLEVEPVPGVPVVLGWDFGLTPACVFTQPLPDGRWLVFDELCGEQIGTATFADCVIAMAEQRYKGFTFRSFGDPAGMQSSAQSHDRAERTCFEILKAKSIDIEAGQQNLIARLESVRLPLSSMVDARPQFVLHPRCTVLRKGFGGKYQYKRVHIAGSAERYHNEPDKNEYSHPHDALQYAATHVFGTVLRGQMSPGERDARNDAAIKRFATKLGNVKVV